MFDLGFGEIALLAIVLLVVVGPRELPRLLRTVGRGISRLRNMSWELRSQSGIDEIIRDEDLQKDIEAVRSLSKGRIVDAIVNEAMRPPKDPYRPHPSDEADEPEVVPARHARATDESIADDGDDLPGSDESVDEDEPVEVDRPARGRKPQHDAAVPAEEDEKP